MGKLDGIDQGMRHRLTGHLSTCINGLQQVTPPAAAAFGPPVPPPSMPVPVLPIPFPRIAAPNIMVMPTNLAASAMGQGQRDYKMETGSAGAQQNVSQGQLGQAQDLNNNTNLNRNERQYYTPASASAFSIVTAERTPPPSSHGLQPSSSLLISPPTSSEGDDTSLSLSFSSTTTTGPGKIGRASCRERV